MQAQQHVMTVDVSKPTAKIQPEMYGIFFEDINFGADGGLYAELVKNRSFEFPQPFVGWVPFGNVTVQDANPCFDRNPHYVRVVNDGRLLRAGLDNEGYRGIGVKQGEEYRFSVYARTPDAKPMKLSIELVNSNAQNLLKKEIEVSGNNWQKLTAVLKSPFTDAHARLRIVLETQGTVDMDHISLFPVNTWKGRENGLRADLAQALYEKRLLTYPRTDSSFLTDDMGGTAAGIIALLCEKLPFMAGADFTPEVAKVTDSKKVSDHHAIIPTMELAKADPDALPESERNILTLAGARLLLATAEPHIFEAVTAVFSCADTEFTVRGKTVISDGWKEMERRYRATLKDKPEAEDGENADVTLPELSEGQGFPNPAAKVTEHITTPPKPHSEASLLSAMERAGNGDTDPDAERRGLGTPATRAAVIEKLVKGGFAERKGKQLIPTQNGAALVSILPDMLTSPQLTAEWENNLTQIAKGAADPGEFLSGIEAMARELVRTHAAALDGKKDLFREEKPSVGKCPRCGSPVHEGKKNYYCSNKECAFVMWKNDRFFEERKTAFSAKIAAALLKSGKANVKKLYSPKTGKTYDGTIVLADTGGKYVNYRIEVQKN